jgi:subfamily B ATP-binding cassette protein MsbA
MTVLLGIVGAGVMFVGARQILAGDLTVGDFFTYTILLGLLVVPVLEVVSIGGQLTEAVAGLARTREVLSERPEDDDPRRTIAVPAPEGRIVFEGVHFAYASGTPVLTGISFVATPGTVTALVGP